MLDRWNAHDIEGHLSVYWKSPELLVVVDSEQFDGWQQLHDSYVNGYPNRIAMGFIQPKRIQVKLLKSDLALALTWWSASFPSSQQTGWEPAQWTSKSLRTAGRLWRPTPVFPRCDSSLRYLKSRHQMPLQVGEEEINSTLFHERLTHSSGN